MEQYERAIEDNCEQVAVLEKLHQGQLEVIQMIIDALLIDLRLDQNLGVIHAQSELIRLHQCRLSMATIHKILLMSQISNETN